MARGWKRTKRTSRRLNITASFHGVFLLLLLFWSVAWVALAPLEHLQESLRFLDNEEGERIVVAAPLEDTKRVRSCSQCGESWFPPVVEFVRMPRCANDAILDEMVPWMSDNLHVSTAQTKRPTMARQRWNSPWLQTLTFPRFKGSSKPLVQTTWPVSTIRSRRVLKAVMFRDPLTRFLSEFESMESERVGKVSNEALASLDEATFRFRYSHLFNRQTRMLLGEDSFRSLGLTPFSQKLDGPALYTIRLALESIHFVGLTEKVPLSLCLFSVTFLNTSETFQKYCTEVDLSRMPVNARNEIGEYDYRFYSRVARYNLLDEVVYGMARSIFFDRIAALRGCHPLWDHLCASNRSPTEDYHLEERRGRSALEDHALYLNEDQLPENLRGSPVHQFAPLEMAKHFKRCRTCGEKKLFHSYVHIHKNAGQTFTSIIVGEFCRNMSRKERLEVCLHYPKIEERPEILEGLYPVVHNERPASEIVGPNVIKGILIRDPISRIFSSHEYDIWYAKLAVPPLDVLAQSEEELFRKHGNKQSFAVLEKKVGYKRLTGQLETNITRYTRSRATLESFHFLGIVEHFRLSTCLWAFTLMDESVVDRHCRTPFEITGSKRNAKPEPHGNYSIYVYAILAYQNRWDELLYRSSRMTFLQRVAQMESST